MKWSDLNFVAAISPWLSVHSSNYKQLCFPDKFNYLVLLCNIFLYNHEPKLVAVNIGENRTGLPSKHFFWFPYFKVNCLFVWFFFDRKQIPYVCGLTQTGRLLHYIHQLILHLWNLWEISHWLLVEDDADLQLDLQKCVVPGAIYSKTISHFQSERSKSHPLASRPLLHCWWGKWLLSLFRLEFSLFCCICKLVG